VTAEQAYCSPAHQGCMVLLHGICNVDSKAATAQNRL
jgi:hypothetical protein